MPEAGVRCGARAGVEAGVWCEPGVGVGREAGVRCEPGAGVDLEAGVWCEPGAGPSAETSRVLRRCSKCRSMASLRCFFAAFFSWRKASLMAALFFLL